MNNNSGMKTKLDTKCDCPEPGFTVNIVSYILVLRHFTDIIVTNMGTDTLHRHNRVINMGTDTLHRHNSHKYGN